MTATTTPTDEEIVLRVLEVRGLRGATSREIREMGGVEQAARRIHDLRRKGFDIRTERVVRGDALVANYVWHRAPGLRLGVAS